MEDARRCNQKWYSGGTPTAGKAEYYDNGDIPWLRTQEVKFSDIDSTEIKITQAALKILQQNGFQKIA